MYKNISKDTQDCLANVQAKMDKKAQGVDKKVVRLQKDLAEARRTKLSLSSIALIKQDIKDCGLLKKHLQSEGMVDALNEEKSALEKRQVKLCKQVISSLDGLIAKGLNSTVHQELKKISTFFNQFEKQEKVHEEKLEKSNPSAGKHVRQVVIELDILHNQKIFFEQIVSDVAHIKVLSKDNLSVSNEYPLKGTRAKLAVKCVASARSELSGAQNFIDDLEKSSMFAMFVGDALNHYTLGVELLKGDPKKIDDASSMDTASRDGIDQQVWEFVRETIYDKEIFGAKAVKEHREKVRIQEAQKLKRSMNKAIGDVSGKTSRTARKM